MLRKFINFILIDFFCLILVHSNIYAENSNLAVNDDELKLLSKERFIAISLGMNCCPASHLSDHGLHIRTFPFDWNVTSFESLYSVIENNFEDFFNLKYLFALDPGNSEIVANTKYNFRFYHQFNTQNWINTENGLCPKNEIGREEYEELFTQAMRRIDRFCKVLELGVPIYFFRFDQINLAQARLFRKLIQTKHPKCNFTLVCIEEYQTRNNSWKTEDNIIHVFINPKIMNIADRPSPGGRHPDFTRIFSDLGLL